jgi:hypothetical protein
MAENKKTPKKDSKQEIPAVNSTQDTPLVEPTTLDNSISSDQFLKDFNWHNYE